MVDYIFRWLGMQFIPGYREMYAPKRDDDPSLTPSRFIASQSDTSANPKSASLMDGAGPALETATTTGHAAANRIFLNGPTQEAAIVVQQLLNPYRGTPESDAPVGHGATPSNGTPKPGDGIAGSTAVASIANATPGRNGHAHYEATATRASNGAAALSTLNSQPSTRSEQFARFQSDAPACDSCGAITVRNGNCYLCHNCGQSMGCS